MKIKKLGHCCFVAEPKAGVRIMTDPGAFSTSQNDEVDISAVIITHEHQDHMHIESLQEILKNNPEAIVITNTAVGRFLTEENINFTKVEEGETYDLDGVKISGFGSKHAEIYGDYGQVQNTGYMIDTLCYPGDAFENPNTKVDILALPIAGPWVLLKEAIDYAKSIKPRIVFPVHDAILRTEFTSFVPKMVGHFLSKDDILMKEMELGKEEEL